MKPIVIIPARLGSKRIPNKPLLRFQGKSLIQHTLRNVINSGVHPIALASDSERVLDEAADFPDIIPVMTSDQHRCGTERVLEAYRMLARDFGAFDVIINIQGDEPFISPSMIKAIPPELEKRQKLAEFWTTVTDLPPEEMADENVAKVVLDMRQNALIFTRKPIDLAKKHTSVYIYTPDFIKHFCSLSPSPLEKAYSLEQMRALDNGLILNCIPLPFDAVSINTVEDLAKAGVDRYDIITSLS